MPELKKGMLLYHGSYCEVRQPDLSKCAKYKDFGQGFYLSDNEDFSKSWAANSKDVTSYLNYYELDTSGLKIKEFTHSLEWYDYIFANRAGLKDQLSDYDVIAGPIANDTLYDTYGILTSGFLKKEDAFALIHYLQTGEFPSSSVFLPLSEDPDGTAHFGPSVMDAPGTPCVETITRKKEKKRPPLLYNLAELQNDCSRFFRISPDQTLDAAQELYEKKLTTYPRTDARVLSSAVAKEITNNLNGLFRDPAYKPYVQEIASLGTAPGIGKTRYTDDKAITDHYAIIPTGQGQQALSSLSPVVRNVYELIVRRFLAIFYPPAVFDKMSLQVRIRTELFSASVKTCVEEGYLKVLRYTDGNGNEFISFNFVLDIEEKGQYISWLGNFCGFDELNRLNEETGGDR